LESRNIREALLRNKLLALIFFASAPVFAGETAITQFSGLNTADTPATLDPSEAQDLLNVWLTPGGKSVFKRPGSGLYKNLPINTSTTSVHGGYHFQDGTGNDVQLWANDSEVASIVAGATPVKISTITVSATMQCTDSQGFAYCFTSARNTPIKTDGTTSGTSFQGGIPLGTMGTMTPERLLVAGVSGNESTVYYSKANTFNTFTVGVNDADAGTEVIASPGSRITHIRYACGKWLWWKDQSFGYLIGNTQYDLENVIISPQIGSLDNSSAYYNGHVYFRGQDNHIYDYDCSNVIRLSRGISPTVGQTSRRISNSWTQDSQSDWQAGSILLSGNLSTTIAPGSVVPSSFSAVDTSTADFSLGSLANLVASTGAIRLPINNSGSVQNDSFETSFSGNGTWNDISSSYNRAIVAPGNGSCGGDILPRTGSQLLQSIHIGVNLMAQIIDINGVQISSTSLNVSSAHCSYTSATLPAPASSLGRRFRVKFTDWNGGVILTSSTYVLGGPITFYYANEGYTAPVGAAIAIDDVTNGSSTITSGSFISRTFDTGLGGFLLTSSTTLTINTSTPTFAIQTSSASTGPWATVATGSGTITASYPNRYVRYLSTISISNTEFALSSFDGAEIIARSTGTFYSQVHNAPNVSQWDVFSADEQTNGGRLTFYTRSSTNTFTTLSSTPSWIAQTDGAQVAASTGTYFQAKVDFGITSATQTPTLELFSFNWFEGSATDKAYIEYFDDHVWISVSSGTTGLNNRVLRWSLLNNTWLLDDLASNGFLVDQNRLFFGSTSQGKVYQFNTGTSDDGAAINSYWKSKDFTGPDPFLQNTWDSVDFIVKEASGTTLSVTYTLDASTNTGSYSLNLYDNGRQIIRLGKNLPAKTGTFYNVLWGDNSANIAWEVLAHRVRFTPLSWRPNP
jgi:hypothetical protein